MRRPFTAFSIAIVVAAGIAIRAGHAFSFVDVAEKPMRIALLIDTSAGTSAAMHQVRSSVATFMDALPPAHEVLLVSTGRRVQFRVPPTTDYKKIKDSAAGLTADGGPTPLMDALREVDDKYMKTAQDRALTFVIVTGDGSESSQNTDARAFNAWLSTLWTRHVAAYALVLKSANGGADAVADAVVTATSGRIETVGNGGALAARMKELAQRIGVDYARLVR
jgi:Mg-chelatase subunit ChlD